MNSINENTHLKQLNILLSELYTRTKLYLEKCTFFQENLTFFIYIPHSKVTMGE